MLLNILIVCLKYIHNFLKWETLTRGLYLKLIVL